MLTLPSAAIAVERPSYRPYRATVARVRRLSPHFTRVTFTGRDFDGFGAAGLDQRVKLVLPLPGIGLSDFGADDPDTQADGSWYARWRALPEAVRNPIRTYTVRAIRQEQREIDVDFVTHGPGHPDADADSDADATAGNHDGGPAANWLRRVAHGDELVIVGPDALSTDSGAGLDWRPGAATRLLLVGDETAVPAISSILESLTAGREADVFLEVPSMADALPITAPEGCRITWLDRGDTRRGHRLDAAVREWSVRNRELVRGAARRLIHHTDAAAPVTIPASDLDIDVDLEPLWDSPASAPDGEFYAWLAGEAGAIKLLRRFLVSEIGIERSRVAFMGYWRLGKAEAC